MTASATSPASTLFDLSPGVKSQPRYTSPHWDLTGTQQVLWTTVPDEPVSQQLQARAPQDVPVTLLHAREAEVVAPHPAGAPHPPALQALVNTLAEATMGVRLILIGSETALWAAQRVAAAAGLGRSEIQLVRVGGAERPVFCVHCRTRLTQAPTENRPCPGCGRRLGVRDHFSRRLGAYLGVQIDAEEPAPSPQGPLCD